jgi:uncharacterized membrane protein
MGFVLSFLFTVLMTVLLCVGIVMMAKGSVWFLLLVLAGFTYLFIKEGCLGH